MEENSNNVKKPFVNRTTREGQLGLKPRRQVNWLASINKLVDINAKRLKIEKDDILALLKFRREEAEANRKHEREFA